MESKSRELQGPPALGILSDGEGPSDDSCRRLRNSSFRRLAAVLDLMEYDSVILPCQHPFATAVDDVAAGVVWLIPQDPLRFGLNLEPRR